MLRQLSAHISSQWYENGGSPFHNIGFTSSYWEFRQVVRTHFRHQFAVIFCRIFFVVWEGDIWKIHSVLGSGSRFLFEVLNPGGHAICMFSLWIHVNELMPYVLLICQYDEEVCFWSRRSLNQHIFQVLYLVKNLATFTSKLPNRQSCNSLGKRELR